jgi:hypothetical protein
MEIERSVMKFRLWLFIAVAFSTACGDKPFTIANGCMGTVAEVRDGDGKLLIQALHYNDAPQSPELRGQGGQLIYLIATMRSEANGRVVGTVRHSINLPTGRSGGWSNISPVGPDQLEPWVISCP